MNRRGRPLIRPPGPGRPAAPRRSSPYGDPVTSALDRAATLGPYFAWERWSPDAGWRPWSELADPAVAGRRVGVARAALTGMFGLADEAVPERVVASVTLLGWAARVVSPMLGAAVVGGELPAARAADLWWRPVPGGPLPVAYSGVAVEPDVTALADLAVEGLLAPMVATFRQRFALSPKVLAGNVASALAGAAGMIADKSPPHAAQAAALTAQALRTPALRGAGDLVRPDPGRPRWFLVRRNCCLYYQIPGGGTCGDCILTPETERRRHWEAALGSPSKQAP